MDPTLGAGRPRAHESDVGRTLFPIVVSGLAFPKYVISADLCKS